jgi:hypothetical protein
LKVGSLGTHNSLGLAKFIFPNDENVYMHGTPAPALFARVRRDFSHGCIRLEDPAALAEWVLRDQPEWTREKIDEAMQGQRPTQVNLREPRPWCSSTTPCMWTRGCRALHGRHLRRRPAAGDGDRVRLSVPHPEIAD